jgi:hypothetical protein
MLRSNRSITSQIFGFKKLSAKLKLVLPQDRDFWEIAFMHDHFMHGSLYARSLYARITLCTIFRSHTTISKNFFFFEPLNLSVLISNQNYFNLLSLAQNGLCS